MIHTKRREELVQAHDALRHLAAAAASAHTRSARRRRLERCSERAYDLEELLHAQAVGRLEASVVLFSVLGQLGRDFGELSGGERDGVRVVDRVDEVVCLVHDDHRAAQGEAQRFPCPRMQQRCIRQQH